MKNKQTTREITAGFAVIALTVLALVLFGLGFSVFIGLAAGFYPANKAVRISALEAMRNE